MQNFLTVVFSTLFGGALFWLVQEFRDRTRARQALRELADERAATEGMRRMSTTYINAELAKGNDIPRPHE